MTDLLAPTEVGAPKSGAPLAVRAPRWLRLHWMLLVLLAVGTGLRVFTVLAYQPAILYIDSFSYLNNLHDLRPNGLRPIGYHLILNIVLPLGGLRAVAIVQHMLGLGIAVAIYLLLLRHGARRWLAALATAPVLLDAYQLQIEHNIMSDVWFQVLLVGVIWVLTWRGMPHPWHAAGAGALIGFAVIVRLVGITMLVPALAYLVVAGSLWSYRTGWRQIGLRAAAMAAAFAMLLVGYVGHYRISTGGWGISGGSDSVLYGRAAVIADCERVPAGTWERAICPVQSRDQRLGVDYYAHHSGSPVRTVTLPPGESMNAIQASFARMVFVNQPLDLTMAVGKDFLKGFRPIRLDAAHDVPVDRWYFQTSYPYWWNPQQVAEMVRQFGDVPISVDPELATVLRGYQLTVGYTPGPLLGLALAAGLLGGLGVGNARRSGIRAASLLVSGLGITVLVTAAAFEFSWRYQLPGLVLLPMAGALGITALTGPLRRPGPRLKLRPPMQPYPDPVDTATVQEFTQAEGEVRFAPVVVLIAAYDEEEGIGAVLDAVPATSCGLPVDTLVIVDGCTDGTTEVARRHGARVCQATVNRGQGAALRLGYRLARRGGARYVVTTDADGQYDLGELPLLLQPLIDDEADFVTGSRVLGRQETSDPVRHLGVRVFAAVARALTRQRLTDTSFGFRAMNAEVTDAVTLTQAQYQASELLLGVISHGYRVVEQPMTMRARTAGETKKGNNLVYGMRYARVMVGTWWRERSTRRSVASSRPKTSRFSSANFSMKSGR
ncbi:MAG TPA: glycosyltransferase family 2 protein [Pseudonocardiaceae bacterium]|nr:glycosyltransferase family 2 protein [Pseudonocardiaceae bacterium]